MASTSRCRVVELEWDRGHESLTAIVRAESADGLIVTEVRDLGCLPGHKWIRADEVVDLDDLDADDASVRLAILRGDLEPKIDVALTKLPELLAALRQQNSLIAVHTARTGSDECLVGSIASIGSDSFETDDVSPEGRPTAETISFRNADVIAVDWGTSYLIALQELLESQ